ncbi:MAG: 6-phosphogluconolactonase [Acidobacteria bacterium]|nr:6-phosphogluconolactonase [Acidobacteriota bacterium]
MSAPTVTEQADGEAAAHYCASQLAETVREAIEQRGAAHVALSGGNTPKRTYELLGGLIGSGENVHLWLADERCVPLDDPESNAKLIAETVDLPEATLHTVDGTLGPDEAAAAYAQELGDVVLDAVLLGLGPDGHTASLFPGHATLEEHARRVLPESDSPKPPPDRVTMSLDTLGSARSLVLLVTGADKADALARTLSEPSLEAPASLLPRERLEVVADRAALGEDD